MTKTSPRVISLFTGAMGLDLGLEKAGFETIACVENEKNCIATIKANRPGLPLYEDIAQVDPNQILADLGLVQGEVELVAGGPPCQAFSTAGRRKSLEDFRGNLIVRYLDYIRAIRPRYFIMENVRGILSAKLSNTPPEYQEYQALEDTPGSVVYFLTKEFKKLGYNVSFSLFDASYYGVPQKRERFVMFGTQESSDVAIPFPTTKNNPLTLKDAIGNLDKIQHTFIPLREKHVKYLKLLKSGEYWKHLPEDLQPEALGKAYGLQGGKTGFFRRLAWNKPSPTLVTHPAMPATMLVHPEELRPLSIQEYARIQQFPNDWIFAGKPVAVYKQIGNAVPVGLGFMAGKAVMAHMQGERQKEIRVFLTSRYDGNFYLDFLKDFSTPENSLF